MIGNLHYLSAMLQSRQRMMGRSPGQFGQDRTNKEEMERMQSPITGRPAPESVGEHRGDTMSAKARDKERRKMR